MVGLSSCAGYTSAAKTGTGSPLSGILSASATTLGFGDVAVANTSTQTLTVTNTGTAPVTIAQASISGAAFTVVGGMPSGTIAVGQSINAQVQFAPTAAGATSGTITIVSDATDSPLDISLTGTGAQAGLSVSPATWNFSNTAVGQTTSENVRLTNTGTSSVVINLATVSGNGFGMSGLSLPKTLSAGQSMTFSAQFAPTAAGAAQGSISFTDNAPNSPQTLTLTGTGVATSATLGASPASVSFGNVSVGSNGQQTVTLTNSGNASATISISHRHRFQVTGLTAITLRSITATFTPICSHTTGSASGSITSQSANNATLSIPPSGSGTHAVASSDWSFSNVIVVRTEPRRPSHSVGERFRFAGECPGAGFSSAAWRLRRLSLRGRQQHLPQSSHRHRRQRFRKHFDRQQFSSSPLVINLTGAGVASQAESRYPASISRPASAHLPNGFVSNPGNAPTLPGRLVPATASMASMQIPPDRAPRSAHVCADLRRSQNRHHLDCQQRVRFSRNSFTLRHRRAGATRRQPVAFDLWFGGHRQQRISNRHLNQRWLRQRDDLAGHRLRPRLQHQRTHHSAHAGLGPSHLVLRAICPDQRRQRERHHFHRQ